MAKKGLLILNLGSPDDPSPKSVARYLRQFLMDPYVVDIPAVLRWPLVNLIIAPTRSHKSAEAYSKVWTKNGSPLVHTTQVFARKLWDHLGDDWSVRWAMRYGQPSIQKVMEDFPLGDVYVVPMYPQFAQSSTQTAIDEVLKYRKSGHRIRMLKDFFIEPEFIEPQAQKIQDAAKEFKPDHILLSYHGLPEHHLAKVPPRYCYRTQCLATTEAIRKALNVDDKFLSYAFQSRLGRRPWIKPYTDIWVEELAKKGVKKLLVSCPSFVADCLETLEEVEMRLKEQFEATGGELKMVPALNDDDQWVRSFKKMLLRSDLEWTNA